MDRVTLSLTNSLDPAAVPGIGPSISGTNYRSLSLAKAVQRYVVFAQLPKDSTLLSTSMNGEPIASTGNSDEGHPVQVLWTDIAPGAASRVSVDVIRGTPGAREL